MGPRVTKAVVSFEGIVKRFPGVTALDGVSFDVSAGEVHALIGENGAGKSTLMKILAGAYRADEGTVRIDGHQVQIHGPEAGRSLGVRMIYQELTVLPNLDVGRNILLGREPTRRGLVDWRALYRQAQAILTELGLDIDARTMVEDLAIGEQQMVEIARALVGDPKTIVLDEPTSSLTRSEEEALFDLVRRLKDRGVAILYISHRMEEIFLLADRATVLRDGQWVATKPIGDVTEQDLIALMVGRDIDTSAKAPAHDAAPVVLEVRDLQAGPRVRGVSFAVEAGEVLGFSGLVGSGRTETALAVFGAEPHSAGEILLNGDRRTVHTPRDAIASGILYIPEDRKGLGLVLIHTVAENLALPSLPRFETRGLLDRRGERRFVAEWIEKLGVRTPSPDQQIEFLSGGNQQKVVLAKWLALGPKVLILDEPTRGIDVGAKAEVFRLIREIAAQGVAVILISSELPEILRESNRIAVFHQGRIAGELDAEDASEEAVMALAFGQDRLTGRPQMDASP